MILTQMAGIAGAGELGIRRFEFPRVTGRDGLLDILERLRRQRRRQGGEIGIAVDRYRARNACEAQLSTAPVPPVSARCWSSASRERAEERWTGSTCLLRSRECFFRRASFQAPSRFASLRGQEGDLTPKIHGLEGFGPQCECTQVGIMGEEGAIDCLHEFIRSGPLVATIAVEDA
jgi:hypothetical protein